jgi:hypothetical protein
MKSRIYLEVHRICSQLGIFSQEFLTEVWKKTMEIRHQIKLGKKRWIDRLISAVLVFEAKIYGYSITIQELLTVLNCNCNYLNSEIIYVSKWFKNQFQSNPNYGANLRLNSVAGKIDQWSNEMNMPREVFERAQEFLRNNTIPLTNTTANIASAACISLSILSLGMRARYRIFSIADYIGISSSSILKCIHKVLRHKRILGKLDIAYLDNVIPGIYPYLIGRSPYNKIIIKLDACSV